jgi:hypothetical protein
MPFEREKEVTAMSGTLTIEHGRDYSLELDNWGNFQKIIFRGKELLLPLKCTFYEVNGIPAEVSDMKGGDRLSFKLSTEEGAAVLSLVAGKELAIQVVPESSYRVKKVSLTLPFALETVFHLAEFRNIGRTLDRTMPVDDFFTARLNYNLLLADCGDIWMRFMMKQKLLRRMTVHISRHPEVFLVTFTWHNGEDIFLGLDAVPGDMNSQLGFFSSMDEAMDDYEGWLENEGFQKMSGDPYLPRWINNVRLIFTIDMMRSYGEICHNYEDVSRLAEELKEIGCPRDTLFYLPGWNGPFDSTGPTYRAHPALGGEPKLKQMVESLHRSGFRVMIHTLGWGIDPYHSRIDELIRFVRKEPDGRYASGNKVKEGGSLASRRIRFRSGKIPAEIHGKAPQVSFDTISLPALSEAYLSMGGLNAGSAAVRVNINGRNQLIPQGWFDDGEEYRFPFPFLLRPNKNRITLEVVGKEEIDWMGCWYQVRSCFAPKNPFQSSTHPILIADTGNPDWIGLFVDEVAKAVENYGIDAVHVDATVAVRPPGAKKLLLALKERLPKTPIGGEWCATLEDIGYWTFSMGATQSLIAKSEKLKEPGGQGSLPVRRGLEELYRWLDKPSPICGFVRKYLHVYPHLCAANGFVPLGKVCNIYPKRLLYTVKEELWDILLDARRLDYIPALRVNYRDYGLDEYTVRAVKELTSR